jgi:hypothetical protein
MKRRIIILITAMVLLTTITNAQKTTAHSGGTTFGIRGGINFQNINGKDQDGNKLTNDLVTRFNLGVNAEIPVGTDFYFQPGLLFTTKGAKNEQVVFGQNVISTVNLSYLELPLNLIYKPALGAGHLLLGFGPYVALGVGGKVKYEEDGSNQQQDVKFKNNVKASDAIDVVYFKPLDAGANLLAGYEFHNKLSFQLNTQLGLTKINPEYEGAADDKSSFKNTGFGLSLGYRFN